MWKGSQERSPQKLAKSRRDYLAQVKLLAVDGARSRDQQGARHQGAERHRCCGDSRYGPGRLIRLLGSLGSNAEVKAEVACFCQQLDHMQLRMLDPKPPKRPTTFSPSPYAPQASSLGSERWLAN